MMQAQASPTWLDARGIDAFVRTFAPTEPKNKPVRRLHALLFSVNPAAPFSERVHALAGLIGWIDGRGRVPGAHGNEPQARVRLLLRALATSTELAAPTVATMRAILTETSALTLFSDMGLPGDHSLLAETTNRLSRRFLPQPDDERDLVQIVGHLFQSQRAATWLASMEGEAMLELEAILSGGDPAASVLPSMRATIMDAIALLTTRVSAMGLSEEIRDRSPQVPLRSSPFFVLPRVCESFLNLDTCRGVIVECRKVVQVVIGNLETAGVSVDVVYRLERIGKCLDRLEALIGQVVPDPALPADARGQASARFVAQLVDDKLRDRRLLDIFRSNLHLLARKVIERAGKTGEHYITVSRREYRNMLLSAGGGGVLTTFTAALKFYTGWAKFPPLVEAMVSASNYAGSFVLMQLLGFTLATKQPSMTAAALAGALRKAAAATELPTLVARITRSQFAAALGNIGLVIPAALAFDLAFKSLTGRAFLDADTSHYVLHSMHPLESGTIWYATLTGILLWLASVGAGWLENWAVYRRLPEAIARHRWRRIFGARFMGWLSRFFEKNISGFGGNVTLGVMLGATPVLGKFTGLPLDARHVTLSTGAVVLAVSSQGTEHSAEILWAAGGIAITGLLNFGVSFVLALIVALRARDVSMTAGLRLMLSVLGRFFRSPIEFFFPPKGATGGGSH